MSVTIDGSSGQLSAKLVVKDATTGHETWLNYDTRLASSNPTNGYIAIFNSVTGLYERFDSLNEAHNKIVSHRERLTYVVPGPDRNAIAAKLGKKLTTLKIEASPLVTE